MKIVVALTSSSAQLSGVQRHAINVTRCLLSRPEISGVDLIVAPWQKELVLASVPHRDSRLHIHTAAISNNSLSRNYWYYSELPKTAGRLQADLVHLAYPVPILRAGYHCPVVVSLHDLYPYDIPDNFGFPKVLFNQHVLQNCLSESDAIACVSRNTKARLISRWHNRFAKKASVIPNIVDDVTTQTAQGGHSGPSKNPLVQIQGRPFLLCVSQHRKNKNIVLVLQVFCRLLTSGKLAAHTSLIIVGIPGPETRAIFNFIQQNHLTSNVILVNGLSDAELEWCYSNCLVLLAPSKIEGFGLPVAEAARIGCRIVCSDIEAHREFLAPQCHFIPLGPDAIESLATAVLEVLKEPIPAPVSMPELSMSSIADKYVQLYRALLTARDIPQESTETLELQSEGSRQYL